MNKYTQAIGNGMVRLLEDGSALVAATADVAGEKVKDARQRLIALPKLCTDGEESPPFAPRSHLCITLAAAQKCVVNNSNFGSIARLSTQGPEDESGVPT
jgi:hypothetical protein